VYLSGGLIIPNIQKMKNNDRRDFLKKSILGISGAAFLPGALNATVAGNTGIAAVPSLPTRVLGKTGIDSPLISMGVGNSTNPNFINAAYNAGVKLFFTASYYREGNNERLLGSALKDVPRDSYFVCTSANPDGFDGRAQQYSADFNPDAYLKKAEGGLQRLELEYVDIFLLPMVCKRETVLFEPVLNVLKEFKKQGKTKYLGIATHDMCEEALYAAADAGIFDVIMIAYNYKVQNKEGLHKAMEYAHKAGLGIIGMKSTAGAFRDKTRTSPLNTDAALKWVLQNENVSTIVSGMSNIDEMQKNLAMIRNLNMSDQEWKDLNLADLRSEPSLYCLQCKSCISQCPRNIDIPTVMRSYMYAYGYRDLEHARYTLAQSGLSGNPCENCDVCKVKCTTGFDVKNRIQDIARLKDVPKEFLMA
jgi:predicted aldo/keto reductase-like oxidoreductase